MATVTKDPGAPDTLKSAAADPAEDKAGILLDVADERLSFFTPVGEV